MGQGCIGTNKCHTVRTPAPTLLPRLDPPPPGPLPRVQEMATLLVGTATAAYMRVGTDQLLVTDCLCCHTSSIVLQSQPCSFRGLHRSEAASRSRPESWYQSIRLLGAPWMDVVTTLDDQGSYFAHLWL